MPMTLLDVRRPVLARRQRVLGQRDGVDPESHPTALIPDHPLLREDVDHRMWGGGVEFGGVRLGEAGDVPGELDHRALEAEADSEEWHSVLARVLGGLDLPGNPPVPEAARDEDSVDSAEVRGGP